VVGGGRPERSPARHPLSEPRPRTLPRVAALSTNSVRRTIAGATHEALLINQSFAADFAQGIRDVVAAVRAGGAVQP
jgi:hypothetical protein